MRLRASLLLGLAAAAAPPPAPLALRFAPTVPCPLTGSAVDLVNRGIAELLPAGRLEPTLACLLSALRDMRSGAASVADDVPGIVEANAAIVSEALAPLLPGARRIIHNLDQTPLAWPPLDAPIARPAADTAIRVLNGALTPAQCAEVIELFEASDLYEGNVL